MKRLGVITNGEINFTNIFILVDKNDYKIIKFKVNEIEKEWKLEKIDYISSTYFQKFSNLPKELKTKGKYTYFNNGSQQFIIDYATENEQKKFISKTGINCDWL